MALTTIKVTTEVRDRLSSDARSQHQPIGQFLASLLDDWERRQRMDALARSIQSSPPDQAYWSEFADFDAIGSGLDRE